jgi:hypothetical protein
MKTIVKTLLVFSVIGSLVSCKSTFNAYETMENQENRNALYQEIISNQSQFSEFIDLAQQNEGAQKIMMQNHMQMMESGKMKTMMEKNPEMKQKMESHMQKMMENPEMKEKMQTMMLDKMSGSSEGRKMMMQKMHENKEMQREMKEKMMQNMKENPAMMEEMMEKMMENPEMKEKMMQKMKEKDKSMKVKEMDHN